MATTTRTTTKPDNQLSALGTLKQALSSLTPPGPAGRLDYPACRLCEQRCRSRSKGELLLEQRCLLYLDLRKTLPTLTTNPAAVAFRSALPTLEIFEHRNAWMIKP